MIGYEQTLKLPNRLIGEASILSAELHAIQMAVNSIDRTTSHQQNPSRHVIYTDSRSSVESLHNKSEHPVIRSIILKISEIGLRGVSIDICWIPSHVGIEGNEKADSKAKDAAKRTPEHISIYFKDYFPSIKARFFNKRNHNWQNIRPQPKLRNIKQDLQPWNSYPDLKRREEVVLNRVRIGHTYATHNYLMDSAVQHAVPPTCHYCNDALLTIKHIFTQCPALQTQRRTHFAPLSDWDLEKMLGNRADCYKALSYLRTIKIFSFI